MQIDTLKQKVFDLLKENDIDVSLLDVRSLPCYGGDIRIYLNTYERTNSRISFRATGKAEKQPDGSWRTAGTRGRHTTVERNCVVFNEEDFSGQVERKYTLIDYNIDMIKRYLTLNT